MKKPNREDDKYWGDVVQGDGIKSIPCLHDVYEADLHRYIDHLEAKKSLPLELTAENGAKSLLNGEFFEHVELSDSAYPCTKVISWSNIKAIYKKVVEHYTDDKNKFNCTDCSGEIFKGDKYCRHCGEIFE